MEKSLQNQKARLRGHYRTIRSSIDEADRRQWDEAICRRVLLHPDIVSANAVFVYLSRSGEVSTTSIVDSLLIQGKCVLTPSPDIRALPHDGLFRVSARPHAEAAFETTMCLESRVDAFDVILVPGIMWDREGFRIGFGGGYFDRLLSMARTDCLKIGLAYECQMAEKAPREPWDKPTNLIITERHTYFHEPNQRLD